MEKGALFGKYEVGRLLGCGAFAKVYYGRNTKTGQSVAIKVINKKKIPGSTLMNNIKREISIMSRLRHPNIVKLYEVLASKSKIYFVMEYVKGGELFTKVAKGRFSEDLSRKYFQQLVSAVGYCHSRGIYHRDLKPENVLVNENGDLKVSDFGLSAVVMKDHNAVLQTLCGTPAYVAPEILAKKGYDGAKVDVWSCGVILYVLTAGYLPFHDPNLMAMYKKIYRGEYKCPKWMSNDLKRFLSRLLESNPGSRITMNEIVGDPWFTKGGSFSFPDNYFYNPNGDDDVKEENNLAGFFTGYCSDSDSSSSSSSNSNSSSSSLLPLNAFHLISFSSGLDLSGLFHESVNPTLDVNAERFVSAEPGNIIGEKIEVVAKEENVNVKITVKDFYCRVELEGPDGYMVAKVDIRPLTAGLVVVEVKKSGGDQSSSFHYDEIWEKKIRPQLCSLVYEEDGDTQNTPGNQAEIVPTPKHAAATGGAGVAF